MRNQSILGGQGHRRGAGGGVFFKRKSKRTRKGKERRRTPGLASGWGDKSRAGCSQAHPGVRGLALLFIRIYSHSSAYIPGEKEKKLNQEIKTFSCQCLWRAWGWGRCPGMSGGAPSPHPTPHPPEKKGKRRIFASCNCFNLKAVLGASVGKH